MSWRIEETEGRIIIYVDHGSAGFGMGLVCTKAQSTGKRLVLDFGGVKVMSSGTVDQCVLLNRHAKVYGVELRVTNACDAVLEFFRITRLDKLFQLENGDEGPD